METIITKRQFWGYLLFVCALSFGTAFKVKAQELELKLRSRALLDATFSKYGKREMQGYYRLEDFRLGVKAIYSQCEVLTDIAYSDGKVVLKDLLFTYSFPNSKLVIGNSYEPYSLDMLISTADLRFHQSASSVLAFTNSRKLGVTYHRYSNHWYASTGIYTHNDINKIGTDKQLNSWVSTSRVVWRTKTKLGGMLNIGTAFSYRSKEVNKQVSTRKISSCGVTSLFGNSLMGVEVDNVGYEVKGLVELLLVYRKWLLQAEYFLNNFNFIDGSIPYRPHGGYIQGSYLIIGEGFKYDKEYSIPGRPLSSRALELVARVNYTQMNDYDSSVIGGEEWDFSLGLNFYFNRFLAFKFSGSYVVPLDGCNNFYSKKMFLPQIRLQYIY